MTEPSGYTALDLIGFTDKGEYDAATNYVRNDVAHYDNTAWLCLIDDTVGVTPVEGNYWTVFIDGSDSYTKTETDSAISAAINALDVTDSATAGSYVTAVSETDGKVSVTREAADATPTASSTKMVTSGGTYTALSTKADQTTIGDSYNASTTYAVDDRFVHSGVRYKVLVACTGITPPNTNYYAVLPIDDDTAALESEIDTLNSSLTYCLDSGLTYHNIPRNVPKDITSYVSDGSLWHRLNGTGGYSLYEDIFVGDYILMSRAISAYEQTQEYHTVGSQYVTIAGIDSLMNKGSTALTSHHLVMVPGRGFGGLEHFGRSRMNSSDDTTGGYVGSEMFTTTIGGVATSGSTESTATINQQLYAEFGSHLLTTYELLSNSISSSRYNRFGEASGCSNGWAWTACQAVLISEVEVFGSIIWSSSGYDTGTANHQLPLFAYNNQAINNRSAKYWLKDVMSSTYFCYSHDSGVSNYTTASNVGMHVRPRFVIG